MDGEEPNPAAGRPELAEAMIYMPVRWPALARTFEGHIALDNNSATKAIF